jgi:hypothetical protein
MRAILTGGLVALLSLPVGRLHAQEQPAKSKIVSVGLFKNGLAVVKRSIDIPGPGTFRLDKVPDAVHGTYWVESNCPVETAVKVQEVDVPASHSGETALQEELGGRSVVVHFKGGKTPPAAGTVVKLERRKGEPAPTPGRFLVLKTAKGRTLVDAAEIGSIEVEGHDDRIKQRKPVMFLTVAKAEKKPVVFVSYLAKGLSWAPSYRVDITDPKTLDIEQQAAIRNELADLDGAEVTLITGFPSVEYAHVLSPLSSHTTWAQFFQQLSQRGPADHAGTANTILQQNIRLSHVPSADLGATPAGEGVDLHYQPIGKRTLAEGDSLALSVARGKAAYERIVEWLIPDNRDEFGRYTAHRRSEEEVAPQDVWDALRFKNPFPFAMTTAPAMVVAGGKFNGQRTSYFVNAGEENVLRITRALSVRTRSVEQEEPRKNGGAREIVYVGGREFRRVTVQGELTASNHRKEEVKVLVRRRMSGDLLSADHDPKSFLREEGVYSVNRRNELVWTLTLRPGEEVRVLYRYAVLVPN